MACLAGERRVLLARETLKGKDGALLYSLWRVAKMCALIADVDFSWIFPLSTADRTEFRAVMKMRLGMGRITVEV